jgi:hypothetical protein
LVTYQPTSQLALAVLRDGDLPRLRRCSRRTLHLVDPTDRFLSVRLRERIGGKARQ